MNKFDQISIQRINTLDTRLIPSAMTVFNNARKDGIPLHVLWGAKTIQEQDLLYRFGRTLPGKIVTMRRGGYSPHNYGLALDFCMIFNGESIMGWDDVVGREYWYKKWRKIMHMFVEEGWEPGWNSLNFQPDHVQNLLGNTMNDLIRVYEETKSGNNRRSFI